MAAAVYVVYVISKIYLLRPDVVKALKVPPITPLIPYIDKVVPSLPPFYFTFWIVILAVIAISHEFSHGIFMRRYDIKLKSTGFGFFPFFLPLFPAAFVEQDEKSMVKAKNFEQRASLAAGTFANVINMIVALGVLGIFFVAAFSSGGVVFNDYSYENIGVSQIDFVNGEYFDSPTFSEVSPFILNSTFNSIKADGTDYIGVRAVSEDENVISLYHDAPAIKNDLNGAITEINGEKIRSFEDLSDSLDNFSPGDKIEIKTVTQDGEETYNLFLGTSPVDGNSAWLGIVFLSQEKSALGKVFGVLSSFKDPNTYYVSHLGEFGWFIYHLLWWLVIISLSVAVINMLPMGIFDGGRFFYLTILSLSGSEKWALRSYHIMTKLFLLLLFVIMAFWVWAII